LRLETFLVLRRNFSNP